jgi:hypothetical protein
MYVKYLQALVETAMLSAVSGLAFLLSTLLKLDNSLGYFLPLPIAIAACRSGVAAAWWTMMATAFLLLGEHASVFGTSVCVWQYCVCSAHLQLVSSAAGVTSVRVLEGYVLREVWQQHGGP